MTPLRASEIQPADDPARSLAQRREQRVRRAILEALAALGTVLTGTAILALIARYDAQGLSTTVSAQAGQLLTPAYQPIADVFDEAARQAANDNFGRLVVYDPLSSAAAISDIRDEFAQAIINSARQAIREGLIEGLREGADAQQTAALLRQVIGLTPQQARAVLNFRRMLEQGDRSVLNRVLRDRRFDATVQRALSGESPLTGEQVDAMVARYAERMLSHRAETIARTESMQAAVSGIRQAYVQAVDTKQLYDSEVQRFWLTAADERVCPVCSSIPVLNRDGVGVHQPYLSLDGYILAPLAHPNCRCSERYQANLTRLRYQPFDVAA